MKAVPGCAAGDGFHCHRRASSTKKPAVGSLARTLLERTRVLRVVLRSLRDTYLTVDARSLGLFRIGLGWLLLFDLARRYVQLDLWYTNAGLLPNHTLLWRPPADHVFSLFFVASSRTEALLGFGACALVYGLFTVGCRTRLMQVLALLCRVSLNSRLAVLENGGDMVLNLLCIFSLALPLGRRFSIDAWLRSLRDGRNGSHGALDPRRLPAIERQPVVSAAMLGLILQFAAIYFFNAISKQGEAWTSGSAVYYALHQDKYVSGVGVWMREHLPFEALRLMTWSALTTEWLGFALLMTPVWVGPARLLAVVILPLLHASFALGLDLGAFSPSMMAFFPLLLTRSHWDAAARWHARRSRPRVIGFPVVGLLRLPGVRSVLEHARSGLARWSAAAARHRVRDDPSDRRPGRARVLRLASEAAVVTLILAITIEVVNDNTSVPEWMRMPRPAWARAVIEYPRLLQGWRMFAPDPPFEDSMIYVDAVTSEGLRVDPYNAVASRLDFPAGDVVPAWLNQNQFFTMYSERIGYPNFAAYRQAFHEWLVAYPQRTGRPADCLTSFEVYLVVDQTPAPGTGASPKPVRRERFMQFVAPADSPCKPTRQASGQRFTSRAR